MEMLSILAQFIRGTISTNLMSCVSMATDLPYCSLSMKESPIGVDLVLLAIIRNFRRLNSVLHYHYFTAKKFNAVLNEV